MAVSSKSIIHYTEFLDSLKGIITSSGFRLKYCLETIVLSEGKNTYELAAAFPMVSFCDLPLTLAKDHIGSYGSYGIGLSKEWAKRHHLNPVLYLEYGSVISDYLKVEGGRIAALRATNLDLFYQERIRFTQIAGFCKNHVGPLVRREKLINPKYVFYNEREWRYLPSKESMGDIPLSIPPKEYKDHKDERNQMLADTYLPFSYDDIKYILVKSDKDITPIIKCLRDSYEEEGIAATKLNSLFTKILTVEQLQNDF